MGTIRNLQRSFGGGEMAPELYGRIDDVKYQSGLALCRNFISKPQGPVENRPGFAYVHEIKDSTQKSRLLPFTYSTTQTVVIELGAGYFRFHTAGATLLTGTPTAYNAATAYAIGDLCSSAGVNYYCIATTTGNAPPNATYWYAMPVTGEYQIPNPYAEADLFDVHFVQSADVLTLVHPNYAPRELRRMGATNWQLSAIAFTSPIATPTGQTATPSTADTTSNYSYVITAVAADGFSESSQSAAATCTNNLFTSGRTNTIAWSAVATAARYNVYKLQGGLYGYIGQTTGLSIVDDNIAPDLSKTPPTYDSLFTGAGDYPGAASYYEQRRCFAGTINKPQNIWMTKSGTESSMSYSLPIRDDDRIAFRVAAREANTIRHIVPLSGMLLLTSSAEWRVTSINSDAITPSSIDVKPQSYVGASNTQPSIVNNTLLYVAARGGHVRECAYNWQSGGFISGDLSLRAVHLFDTYDIVDMAYSKAPQPIVWMVSTSGKLLGITYIPEQQIGAWHQHDTDGLFESCTVVAEGNEDVLYVIVNRTINGVTKRYVERMATRMFVDPADAFFVDCGFTYSGAPATTISGLSALEGKTVNVLADASVHPQCVVTGGAITLNVAASKVQVGLPITADVQTLPVAMMMQDGSYGQGHVKNVNKVWLRVHRSSGIFVGPDFTHLTEVKQRTTESPGTPPALKDDEVQVMITPSWGNTGQVCIRQSDPLPLTIINMTAEIAVGG